MHICMCFSYLGDDLELQAARDEVAQVLLHRRLVLGQSVGPPQDLVRGELLHEGGDWRGVGVRCGGWDVRTSCVWGGGVVVLACGVVDGRRENVVCVLGGGGERVVYAASKQHQRHKRPTHSLPEAKSTAPSFSRKVNLISLIVLSSSKATGSSGPPGRVRRSCHWLVGRIGRVEGVGGGSFRWYLGVFGSRGGGGASSHMYFVGGLLFWVGGRWGACLSTAPTHHHARPSALTYLNVLVDQRDDVVRVLQPRLRQGEGDLEHLGGRLLCWLV